MLSTGNDMSRAPIWSGMMKFPKAPIRIGVTAKKTMSEPCIVKSFEYSVGITTPWESDERRCPRTGMGWNGWAICQRMRIAKRPATRRKNRPVKRYCFPITLWSVEKTYLRRKLVGSDTGLLSLGPRDAELVVPLAHPLVELLGSLDDERPPHRVVPEPAELGAHDLVAARHGRLGVEVGRHAGEGVLLHAHVRQAEAVDHVARAELEDHGLAGRDVDLARHGRVVGGVELAVGSRVAEGPEELLGEDADPERLVGSGRLLEELVKRVGIVPREVHVDPHEDDEHEAERQAEGARRVALRVARAASLARPEPHDGDREDGDDDHERGCGELAGQPEELVDPVAVQRGILRKQARSLLLRGMVGAAKARWRPPLTRGIPRAPLSQGALRARPGPGRSTSRRRARGPRRPACPRVPPSSRCRRLRSRPWARRESSRAPRGFCSRARAPRSRASWER